MAADIMIDLETLDTSPFCCILSIGVVLFDPKGSGIIDKIELRPTLEDQTELGRTINEDTIRWWSTQSSEAQLEALGDEGRISFKEAMEQLYKFCWNRRAVWSNGAAFDCVVMETAWTDECRCGIRMSFNVWKFKNEKQITMFLIRWTE